MASFSAPKAQPIEARSYNRPFGWATTQKYALGFGGKSSSQSQ